MAYLLALTVIQVLMVILFLKIRSIRDERGEIIRILIFTAIIVILVKYFSPLFNSHINLLFTATSSLCLVSLSSLYLRNTTLEARTSGYLFLLALFPFLFFYVFFLLFNIYSYRITNGMIYEYLDFFHQKSRTILFAITLVYDLCILWPWRKKLERLLDSIDGQLAFSLFVIKILVLAVIIYRGVFYSASLFLDLPDGLFTFLILISILFHRYFNSANIYFAYLFKTNGMVRLQKQDYEQIKKAELIFYISAIDQLIDQEKLFKNPDFQLSDLKKFLPLTDRTLKNLSKRYLNGSFENYLNGKRISYFIECLSCENHEATVINKLLFEAGFKNDYEFNRIFKKEIGCSVWKYAENKRFAILQSGLT